MAEALELSHLTLPIPNDTELALLQAEQAATPFPLVMDFDRIAQSLMERNPNFREALNHGTDEWFDRAAPDDMSESELDEYVEGIEDGFSFFIGVATAVRYMRSGFGSVKEFMNQAAERGDVPTLGDRELERVKVVQSGKAIIAIGDEVYDAEETEEKKDGDSSEDKKIDSRLLAPKDSEEYLLHAGRFATLMEAEKRDIKEMLDFHADPDKLAQLRRVRYRLEGFDHGVANAVEMYIQVEEERIIQHIERI